MAFRQKTKEKTGRRVETVKQSVPTYSYHHNRSGNSSENLTNETTKNNRTSAQTAKKLWLEKFGFILLAVAVGVCMISILYISDQSVAIIEPTSSGPSFNDYSQKVEDSANKLIASSILNRNKITFDSQKITNSLAEEYPMFSNISITLPLIDHHPVIYLTPAKPILVLNVAGAQYLVNQDGQIILYSPSTTALNKMNLPKLIIPGTPYLTETEY